MFFGFEQEDLWVSFSHTWFQNGAKTPPLKEGWRRSSTRQAQITSQSSLNRLLGHMPDLLPMSPTHQKYGLHTQL